MVVQIDPIQKYENNKSVWTFFIFHYLTADVFFLDIIKNKREEINFNPDV